ncbi:DedA family protein [Ornithinimicrobium sp. Y1694]|uniref:DedA family protein n=1 Tax=Ornithinimicrobium sp. Y1694 TaxID=3418590 RepID=UPI003CEC2F85
MLEGLNAVLLAAADQPWVLLALFAFCVIDGFFPPVPSESLVVGLAVISVSAGRPDLWLLILVAAAGAAIGDNIAYQIGRTVGTRRFRWMRTRKAEAAFARADELLATRGAVIIITGRHIPLGRVAINMAAGATAMHRPTFVFLTVISGLVWAGLAVGVGVLAGHWLGHNPLLGIVVAILAAMAIGLVVDRLMAWWSARTPVV